MERLHMHQIHDIIYRLRLGQSERGIARDLGLSRITVHRYHAFALQQGYLTATTPLPEEAPLAQALGGAPKPPHMTSTVEPHRALVEQWLQQGVEQMAIYQRLVRHHEYGGSYSSVRRFVAGLCEREAPVVVRVETAPGQQAQVDFGSAGRLQDPRSGGMRPAYVFVMTLCYSRHCYLEFVLDQTMATFVGCHQRAFASFGGVVQEVVVDNLKAAILSHALEDPVLSRPYHQMAQHYQLLIHPCRPRTPQHKGKVESGVHYVKRNFLSTAHLVDLGDANRQAQEWVREVAGVRRHGTTQTAPLARFVEQERDQLRPLPTEPFELVSTHRLRLHRDCHVVLGGSFYSAPCQYVGQELEAHLFERVVQLYHGTQLLVTHPRARQAGERLTRLEHYPQEKAHYLSQTPQVCLDEAQRVGPACQQVVERLLAERPADHLRAAQALLRLREQVGTVRLEAACSRALHYGDARYRRVKAILAAGLDAEEWVEPGMPRPLSPGASGSSQERRYVHARGSQEFFGDAKGEEERDASPSSAA